MIGAAGNLKRGLRAGLGRGGTRVSGADWVGVRMGPGSLQGGPSGRRRTPEVWSAMPGSFFLVLFALQGLILLSLWGILYPMVKQWGRLLLRLDDIEARLA